MPSALTNDASAAEIPTRREGNADTLVGKMDGVIRRAGTVITAATDKESNPPPAAEDRAGPKAAAAAAGQEMDMRREKKKIKPNKHSMDYMMRSFVAGGLAGCAVCRLLSLLRPPLRLHLWLETRRLGLELELESELVVNISIS